MIGTRGSWSEALSNHLAFTYFALRGLLALPITICEGGGNGAFGQLAFTGLMTFDVSIEKGITEHGRVPFVTDPGAAPCSQWWTDARSVGVRPPNRRSEGGRCGMTRALACPGGGAPDEALVDGALSP